MKEAVKPIQEAVDERVYIQVERKTVTIKSDLISGSPIVLRRGDSAIVEMTPLLNRFRERINTLLADRRRDREVQR